MSTRQKPPLKTLNTVCKVGACEPYCGLEIDVDQDRMVAVRPDKQHPLSEGYVCIKGVNVLEYQNSPDRLHHPLRRQGDDWQKTPWPDAIRDIGARLRAIAVEHGPRSIATYWGNAADSIGITMANTFCHAFGSNNSYNVLSLEYTDRGVVAEHLYGNENIILQPDVEHAKYALLLGTNPVVTQGLTLLQRRPHVASDLKEAKANGCQLVVVDPRVTETTRLADLHLTIRPGTDLFFLLALIHVITTEDLVDHAFIDAHTNGFAKLTAAVADMTAERAAAITGIGATIITRVARELAAADGTYVTTRVGVQTSHNSTLTEWAVACLVAITGNIDRPGGLFYNYGVIDTPALIAKFTKRKNTAPSRIGGFPPVFGGLPSAVLADEILTEGDGQIRALVVVAGNPVISFPETPKIEEALKSLDLLVVIDIFLNDTATFADYVLPAATAYEREVFHFLVDAFNPYPYAELRQKVVDPPGECRGEWEIFKDLSRAAGVPFLNNPVFDRLAKVLDGIGIGFTPELLHRYLLLGKTPSYGKLRSSPRGAPGASFAYGRFFEQAIKTADRRIHLAPQELVGALDDAFKSPRSTSGEFPFMLISGARRLASFNSWTHNMPSLMRKLQGNHAIMNDEDAAELGIDDDDMIEICSSAGVIEIAAHVTSDMSRGVVAVHQHWGHTYPSRMTTANQHPGVNVNRLHPDGARDRFCGMPIYNGTPVAIRRVGLA